MQLVVLAAAEREFGDAAAWYRERSPSTADHFSEAVAATFDRIKVHPRLGSRPPKVARADLRWMKVDGFPYHVVYSVRGQIVGVLAIAHDRRRPGYYLSRVRR
jgi:plasmid stabilization system protein ParE